MSTDKRNYNWQDWSQQHRSAYQPHNNAHRVDAINAEYNSVNYTYNVDGSVATIQYLYDSECEVTNILTSADIAGSLDGKSLDIYSGKDTLKYVLWYKVGIGTPAPADTATIKYIEVSLFANDPAAVVAKASYNAILAHSTASVDLIPEVLSSTLNVTATVKGATTDSVDVDTGFTINTTTQGLTDVVDTARLTYDANGNVLTVITDSGENIVDEPVKNIRNLNHLRDNISIKDSDGDELKVNSDGSINVSTITSPDTDGGQKYGEIASLASGSETTIVSHTAVISKTTFLQAVSVSGDNIAKYRVKVNGTTVDTSRTYFGGNIDANFKFYGDSNKGIELSVGDIITVTVIHSRPMVGDFNAKIQYIEVT